MQVSFGGDHLPAVFAIQHIGINMHNPEWSLKAMDGISAYGFGVIPFSHELTEIDEIPTNKIVIPLAGVKIIDLHYAGKLPSNWRIFHDRSAFDQEMYLDALGYDALNRGAQFYQLDHILDVTWSEDRFMKPTNDLKMFAGLILHKGNTLRHELANLMHMELDMKARILVGPVHQLFEEYRIIMAFGKIAGMSQYMDRGRVTPAAIPVHIAGQLADFVYSVHERYQPEDVYTIDVAIVGATREMKIIEYNCFNCSGMYEMNRTTVFNSIIQGLS